MAKIGIVGYGPVGQATGHTFKQGNDVSYYDTADDDPDKYLLGIPRIKELSDLVDKSEFIFLCLPTPIDESGEWPKIDLRCISKTLEDITPQTNNTSKTIVVKSTVTPGTTRDYFNEYLESNICCSPEFLTESASVWDANHPARNVVGADDECTRSRLRELYNERFPIITLKEMSSIEAEITKYMNNMLGATKVIFGNVMHALCGALSEKYEESVNYDTSMEAMAMDKRFSSSHLTVTPEGGFGGKCFPKDMLALTGTFHELGLHDEAEYLRLHWKLNLKYRDPNKHDWLDIPGTGIKPIELQPEKTVGKY